MRGIRSWAQEGLCRLPNNSIIFEQNPRRAKKICQSCPVAGECLQYSLIYREQGVWGGFTFKEREYMLAYTPTLQDALIKEAQAQGIYEHRYSIADDYSPKPVQDEEAYWSVPSTFVVEPA